MTFQVDFLVLVHSDCSLLYFHGYVRLSSIIYQLWI